MSLSDVLVLGWCLESQLITVISRALPLSLLSTQVRDKILSVCSFSGPTERLAAYRLSEALTNVTVKPGPVLHVRVRTQARRV